MVVVVAFRSCLPLLLRRAPLDKLVYPIFAEGGVRGACVARKDRRVGSAYHLRLRAKLMGYHAILSSL